MFKRKALACSFCGKDAAQVTKLVAGPGVYICDSCVAEASRIMNTPGMKDTADRTAIRVAEACWATCAVIWSSAGWCRLTTRWSRP